MPDQLSNQDIINLLTQGKRSAGPPAEGQEFFKVWVEIERYDPDRDDYETIGMPQPIGYFITDEDAEQYVERIARLIFPEDVNADL